MSAATDVDICNSALMLLGSGPITSLDPAADASDKANLCRQFYNETRDAALQEFPWNFAIRRASLSQLSESPAFEWLYAHRLPNDPYCLRVLNLHDTEIPFKVEGRSVVSNSETIKIRYIARVEDVSEYSYMFRQAFASLLSSKLAYGVTGSTTKTDKMLAVYAAHIADAEDIDSQEGTPDTEENDDLIWVR